MDFHHIIVFKKSMRDSLQLIKKNKHFRSILVLKLTYIYINKNLNINRYLII